MSFWSRKKKTSGMGNYEIRIAKEDSSSFMESVMEMGAKCKKCGATITFEDGGSHALEHGIRNKVMCKKCNSVYEVDISPSGMILTKNVSKEYKK